VADDVELPESLLVTAMANEAADEYAQLTPAETEELVEAIEEADRGEGVLWATVRDELLRSGA
jgi:hypothetical protein